MEKICLRYCKIGGIPFNRGELVEVEFNPVDGRFYASNVWGTTPLTDGEYRNIFA